MFKRFWQWLRSIGQEQPEAGVPVTANQELSVQVAMPQAPEELLIALVQAPAELPAAAEVAAVEQMSPLDDIADVPTTPLVAIEQAAVEQTEVPEQSADVIEQIADEAAQPTEGTAQPEPPSYDTPEQRAQKVSELDFTGLSARERVAKVLELFPDLSDRELGKLSGVAPATAKKHREALKPTQPVVQESEEA